MQFLESQPSHLAKFLSELTQPKERVTVRSAPLVDRKGYVGYEIIGLTEADVQREIDRVTDYVDMRMGASEFSRPQRSREPTTFGKFRSIGWTAFAAEEVV